MRRRDFFATALGAGSAALAALRVPRTATAHSGQDATISAVTLDGARVSLPASALERLRARLDGEVLLPGSERYEQARRIWNGAFHRRPAVIARCASAADVRQAVAFAREHSLLTAVRGGGHSLSGQSVCDDGIMIDLAPMKRIAIDPLRKTAHVDAGVLLGDLDREAQAFGLATTVGTVTHTGVAGLTLGGGYGRLARKFGLTCDNLLAARIVTSDAALHSLSARENADLFWGIRGGGGNFGIVTSFVFQLHPVSQAMLGGTLLLPFESARAGLDCVMEIASRAPDELYLTASLIRLPDGTRVFAPEVCFCGAAAAGEELIAPLRRIARPLGGAIAVTPYLELQRGLDAMTPPGRNYFFKSGFVRHVSQALLDEAVRRFADAPACLSALALIHTGGAISRVRPQDTAAWNRAPERDLLLQADWGDGADSARNVADVRAVWTGLEPFTEGYYVNTDTSDDARRLRLTYGDNYERLVRLKDRYDSLNLFRLNANIRPS